MSTQDISDPASRSIPALLGGRECPFEPPRLHAEAREREGLGRISLPGGEQAHLITRFEEARAALTDERLSADIREEGFPLTAPAERDLLSSLFMRAERAEHRKAWEVFGPEFSVRHVRSLEPFVRSVVEKYIDELLADGGPLDLVTRFARPVPLTVISRLIGVPVAMRRHWIEVASPLGDIAADPRERAAAHGRLAAFFTDLVELRRRNPGEDMISRAVADLEAGRIEFQELVRGLMLLFGAGQDSTAHMIGLGAMALARDPGQLAALREDPGLAVNAVEEMLRCFSVLQTDPRRVAVEDLTVGGHPVRAGEGVVVSLVAANHDPRVFGAGAERPDVTREPRAHLAFGFGDHKCLGQNLARMELCIVYQALARRMPNLRIAVPFEELRFHDNELVYGLLELPVEW